jgi:DNA-binding NarL/FixJ family response regulator
MFKDRNKIRTLIVDDDPETAVCIERLLRKRFRAVVDKAGDVSQAWARLDSGRYDVIILDYQLPDGNGLDILRQIPPRQGHVIIVTGHGDEAVASEAFRLCACGYVVKDDALSESLFEAVACALGL